MQQLSYFDFNLKLEQDKFGPRRPWVGEWALTAQCNLRCQHCYVVEDKSKEELTFSQIAAIMDELAEAGCLWLTLTGGEPLLRRDALDIYDYARQKGFLISLFTNGTLLNEESLARLAQYPPLMIEITLHSLREEVYERVTRVTGSFRKCMQAIRDVVERGLPLTVKTVGMICNKEEVFKIKEFCRGLGDVQFKFDPVVNSRQDGDTWPIGLRLSADEVMKIVQNDWAMLEQLRQCHADRNNFLESNNLFTCHAGLTSFHINPYGELGLCPQMPSPNFNLTRGSFKQGFYDFLYSLRGGVFDQGSPCRGCEVYHLCGQCPARALSEIGDVHKPVEYFCELAHRTADIVNLKEKCIP